MTVQQAFALAQQYEQGGRLAEAEACYRQILAVAPNHTGALHQLALLARQVGRLDLAEQLLRQVMHFEPANMTARCHLGDTFGMAGAFEPAIEQYEAALRLKPDYAEALNNLGLALAACGRLPESRDALRRARDLRPGMAEIHMNLANSLRDLGELGEAIENYRRALELKADYGDAYDNLGIALGASGRQEEALEAHRRACELQPANATYHNNVGVALAELGKIDEAMAEFERALVIEPANAMALNGLGNAFRDSGRLEEAIALFRRASQLDASQFMHQSNLIYTLHFLPGENRPAMAEEQRRWNRLFAEPVRAQRRPHANTSDPERRLRIGYVSPDFRDHVVGRNLLPLLSHHDRTQFEIICYAGVARPDEMTRKLREQAEHWRSGLGLTSEALAAVIREDAVDILVDLSQHMAGNRLPVFAREPAPVQVSFAGYPESTGVEMIRYRISDKWLEGDCRLPIGDCRLGEASMKPETLETVAALPYLDKAHERVYLIDSFWCYDPCGMDVSVNPLPADSAGQVTFGCLNNFCKVNEPLLALWARVLRDVPDARLLILCGLGSRRQRTLEYLERAGVAPDRVEFAELRLRREYLELYHRVDVVLDSFPYNGHTTSLDALWMGVPVVTLAGEGAVSRAGLSQLSNLGLSELVADGEDRYVEIATNLAADRPRLAAWRRTLRARLENSILMDAQRFAQSIEEAYRAMWRQWCAQR
jgi:predicted O-linked N-acetylglucosamine transferase (SPINDLY family)